MEISRLLTSSHFTAKDPEPVVPTSSCFQFKSNHKVHAYIVKHNYVLGGMVFTVCKAQLHDSATNVGHLQVVQF